MSEPSSTTDNSVTRTQLSWFLMGTRGIVSVPAIILMSAMVGFAGLARENGITFGETVFMTATIWALPSQVVLVGAIASGTALATAAFAVSLSAVRLMPMIVTLMPVMRADNSPRWALFGISHFVAITAWVFAMQRLPALPRRARLAYFSGFAITLTTANVIATAVAYQTIGALPALVAGALFFLTPVYFLYALSAAANLRSDTYAMIIGLVLGPLFSATIPDLSLLLTGVVGGTLAYAIHRVLGAKS